GAAASALDLGPAPQGPAPAPYPEAPVTGGFPAVMSDTGGFAIPTARVSAAPSGTSLDAPVGTGGFPEPALGGAAATVTAPPPHAGGPRHAAAPGHAGGPAFEDGPAYEDGVVPANVRHAGSPDVHELAVVRGWARLLAVLVIVLAGCASVMMPVVGVAVSAFAVAVLRMARARGGFGLLEALGRTLVSVPYAAVFAVAVPLMVMGLAAADVELSPLGAIALGAGTGTIALWTAPGAGGARRALETAFEPLAWRPGTLAVAGLVLGVLTLGGLVAAMSFTPSFAPLYGLQSSLEATLSRFQNALH
ncbi:hypothetical protein AB0J52_31565, partial [Spirillospora sp. NPDC049652]